MNDRDHQIKQTSFDDENQRLKFKHKEDLKDQELIAKRDIKRLEEAHLSTEQTLKEQLTKLENIRTSLERVEFSSCLFDQQIFLFIY
jgi:phage terminase Nu1 subunit (DNA packaging protein)